MLQEVDTVRPGSFIAASGLIARDGASLDTRFGGGGAGGSAARCEDEWLAYAMNGLCLVAGI